MYYGPLGEHVRSRSIALQLAALYELPTNIPRIPSPEPTNGAPTANGHANAPAAVTGVDPAGAAASAQAIAQSQAAARAAVVQLQASGKEIPPSLAAAAQAAAASAAVPSSPVVAVASPRGPVPAASPSNGTVVAAPAVATVVSKPTPSSPLPGDAAALADALFQ